MKFFTALALASVASADQLMADEATEQHIGQRVVKWHTFIQSSNAFAGIKRFLGILQYGKANRNWGMNTCSHTKVAEGNWLKVSFKPTKVSYVKVLNRGDCCQQRLEGAVVLAGNKFCGIYHNKQAVAGW